MRLLRPMDSWKSFRQYLSTFERKIIDKLIRGDRVPLQLSDYRRTLNRKLKELSKKYSRELSGVFAGSQPHFEGAGFCFQLDIKTDSPPVSIPMSKFMLNKGCNLDFNFRIPSPNKDELILQITSSASSVLENTPKERILEREISRKLRDYLLFRVPRALCLHCRKKGGIHIPARTRLHKESVMGTA